MKETNTLQNGPSYDIHRLVMDGIFTAILVVLGMIKLPSILPGAEFQLSAPYAVCLVALVGFWRYLGIGICASCIQLMLGTHTIWNVLIAMVFRVAAGLIVSLCPDKVKKVALVIAGPVGTATARVVLAWLTHVSVWPLLVAAVPGMIFTAVGVSIFYPILLRLPIRRTA